MRRAYQAGDVRFVAFEHFFRPFFVGGAPSPVEEGKMALFNKYAEMSANSEQSATPHPGPAHDTPPPITLPASKIVEPRASAVAYLDRGSKASGKLHFEGAARIDGDLDGEVDGKEITIGESAEATAQIRADSIVVSGRVKGDITATQRIELRATATVIGNITSPKLVVHEGAVFEGHCSMGQVLDGDRKIRVAS
jgi:cytoskeletal protein CcmA (bactofilin family)